MATIFGSIETLIHDTADALVQSQITKKMADMYSGFISAGFGVVDESLKVVRDVTSSSPPPPPPKP
jgi:hypothetical protein